jgi:hypothetical protein
MPAFKSVSISGPNLFEVLLKPNFGDFLPNTETYNGMFGEFAIMDGIKDSRKIIDISRYRNILKRRDASCKIVYEPVGEASLRRITVTELYGATANCATEFYQGCLEEWRKGDTVFLDKIGTYFRKAIQEDMLTNLYFGDVTRPKLADDPWAVSEFDGVITQLIKYIEAGVIPASQTDTITAGAITPANAKLYLQEMYEKLRLYPDGEKAFYIDQQWADAYEEYLIQTGATNGLAVNYVQDGITVRAYKGIPIFVNRIFAPVLRQTTGDDIPHLGLLTIRGNFIFGTDSSYGEGPNLNEALKIWYDWNTLEWKWLMFLKAGTQVFLPQHVVIYLPA